MPVVPGEHVGRPVARRRHLGLGGEQDARLDIAALRVGAVELPGHGGRPRLVLGQHQLETGVGAMQASSRVDARRQPEADRPGVETARVGLGDAHERPEPGLRGSGKGAQARAHEPAVLAQQGDAVRHGGQRDEVEVVSRRGPRLVGASRGLERLRELEGDAGGAQVLAGVGRHRRMHDRGVRKVTVRARAVVVGDEHVESRRPRGRHLLDRGDRAVDGHQQARPAGGEALHGAERQAVAVVQSAGQVPVHLGSEPPQAAYEHRRGAHAVDVVVAVDGDSRAGAQVPEHEA